MKDSQRKAMFAKNHNSSSLVKDPKERYVWYNHEHALKMQPHENKTTITRGAPKSIKFCSRCNKSFDSSQAKGGGFMQGLICNACHEKDLKPSSYPAHWQWNKMTQPEKEKSLQKIVIGSTEAEVYSKKKFEELPKTLQKKFADAHGIVHHI